MIIKKYLLFFFIFLLIASKSKEDKNKSVDYKYIHPHFQNDYCIIEDFQKDTLNLTDFVDTTLIQSIYPTYYLKLFIKNTKFNTINITSHFKNVKFEIIIKSIDSSTINNLLENEMLKTNLNNMIFNEVEFDNLPSKLNKISNLKSLSFADMKEINILDFKQLPISLINIYFLGTKLNRLPKNQINNNIELLSLDVSKQNEIPRYIGNIKNLEKLILGFEDWESRFNIYKFNISSLKRIKNIKINYLEISCINLIKDYKIINQFNKLKELILFNCNLNSLNDLNEFPELELFYLPNNKIRKFPKQFYNYKNLKEVILDNNPLDSLSYLEYKQFQNRLKTK